MAHPPETYICDRVLFYPKGDETKPHVAFVIEVYSEHCADLVYYCPVSHKWQEAKKVEFGKQEGADYFVNPKG